MYKDAYDFQVFQGPAKDSSYAVLGHHEAEAYFSRRYRIAECSILRLKRIEKILTGRHEILKKTKMVLRSDGRTYRSVKSLLEFRAKIQSRIAKKSIEKMIGFSNGI